MAGVALTAERRVEAPREAVFALFGEAVHRYAARRAGEDEPRTIARELRSGGRTGRAAASR